MYNPHGLHELHAFQLIELKVPSAIIPPTESRGYRSGQCSYVPLYRETERATYQRNVGAQEFFEIFFAVPIAWSKALPAIFVFAGFGCATTDHAHMLHFGLQL